MKTSLKVGTLIDQPEQQKNNEQLVYDLLNAINPELANLVYTIVQEHINPILLQVFMKALLNIIRTTNNGNISLHLDNGHVFQVQGKNEYRCDQSALYDERPVEVKHA